MGTCSDHRTNHLCRRSSPDLCGPSSDLWCTSPGLWHYNYWCPSHLWSTSGGRLWSTNGWRLWWFGWYFHNCLKQKLLSLADIQGFRNKAKHLFSLGQIVKHRCSNILCKSALCCTGAIIVNVCHVQEQS